MDAGRRRSTTRSWPCARRGVPVRRIRSRRRMGIFPAQRHWRQRGTGGARAGYKSSVIWRGGGVVFGPKPRDYSKKVSKTTKRLALQKALSERIKAGDVVTVDKFAVAELKTKSFIALLKKQTDARKVLILSDSFDTNTYKSARNVKPVLLATAANVNAEQLLAFDKILVTPSALEHLAERMNRE